MMGILSKDGQLKMRLHLRSFQRILLMGSSVSKVPNSLMRIFFDRVITRWQLANVSYLAEVSMLAWIVNSEKDGDCKMWLANKCKEVQRLVKAVQTARQWMRPVQVLRWQWQSKLLGLVYPCFGLFCCSRMNHWKLEVSWTFVWFNKQITFGLIVS